MKGKMGNGLKHDDPSNSFSANAPQCTMVPLLHSPSLVHFPPLSFEHPPPTLLYPSPSALPFPSALLYPFAPPPILLYPNPSSLTSLFPHPTQLPPLFLVHPLPHCSTLPLVHSSFPSASHSPRALPYPLCNPSYKALLSTPPSSSASPPPSPRAPPSILLSMTHLNMKLIFKYKCEKNINKRNLHAHSMF